MATPDGRHRIVFNGEVYNYRELRRSLEARGERFTTGSDTEVLLRLLACDGPAALAQVRGMFALAWWDAEARVAGARARSLRHQAAVRRGDGSVDRVRVGDSRAGRVRPGRAHDRSGRRAGLPGMGHGAAVADLRRRASRAWRRARGCAGRRTARAFVQHVCGRRRRLRAAAFGLHRSRFARSASGAAVQQSVGCAPGRRRAGRRVSVRRHRLVGDPVGRRSTPARLGLNTYTVRFDDRSSEHEYARLVASTFGATHHELVLDPSRIVGDLPRILARLDQPTLDAVNSYYVSAAVAETGIKAVLSGIGRRRDVRRLSVVPPPAGGDALEAAPAARSPRR